MTSSTVSSLMTSSATFGSLDPVLVDFWSAFPCPPPWNEGLLFRLNWTSCVSQTVGQRIVRYLADRCHIPHNDSLPLPLPPDTHSPEACDVSCQIVVGVVCFLFLVAVLLGVLLLWHRRRSQKKDQRGGKQTTGGSGGERGRTQYAGIHYASASVITREGEVFRMERPLPPCPEGQEVALPRQLHSYVYNPRDGDQPAGPGHLHLCPMNRRAAYRAMEPRLASASNDEPPHHYDYISDTDSVRYRGSVNEYTYCTCDTSEGSSSVAAECNSSTPRVSEGYYSDHDHKQHEVSKPHPRYPDKALLGAGGEVKTGSGVVDVSGLNNTHNGGSPGVGFPGENGRRPRDPGSRGLVSVPATRTQPPAGPGVCPPPPSFPEGGGVPWERSPSGFPEDRNQNRLPVQRMNSYEIPVPGGVQSSPAVGDLPVQEGRTHTGGTLRFVNAPSDDVDTSAEGQVPERGGPRDHRHNPVSAAGQRTNLLAVHPQYFADYFDASTSSA